MNQILQLSEQGNASDLIRDMRVRSLYSPYFFTKVVLGYKELVDHFHLVDTELFVKRWLEGCRLQWIEWPRGFFKSTTFTIGVGMWVVLPYEDADSDYALDKLKLPEDEWFSRLKLHDRDATQLYAFETDTNAKKKVGEVKWHFESNELFRVCFPEIAYEGSERPWNNECIKIRRTGFGMRQEEGSFEAIGAGAALQSRHYKIVWEDDLVGKRAIESEVEMAKTIRWHGLLHGAFENAAQQIRFGVSNRWGYSDLNSHVRANEPEFVFHTRKAWEIDHESGREVAIFPERYSIEALAKLRDNSSMTRYDFSCQYLNSPTMPGEKEVDLTKIHTYIVSAIGQIECSCGARFFPTQLNRYLHYDPYNAKGVASKSCPAILAVGTSTDKHVIILDYFTGKGSYTKIFEKLFEMNNIWKPGLFTYEDVGNQNMAEFYIKNEQGKADFKHRRFPRILPVKTGGKAKEVRIRDYLLPVLGQGKFAIRAKHQYLLTMLETFPNPVLDHDYDLLDAAAQGATVWKFPLGDDEIQTNKVAEDAYLAQLGKSYSHTAEVK